jgi:hypothetical protein
MSLTEREERLEDALRQIVRWADAYPLDIFPEPDLKLAHDLLTAHGVTLDALSAHAMRHCLVGVRKIADDALNAKE